MHPYPSYSHVLFLPTLHFLTHPSPEMFPLGCATEGVFVCRPDDIIMSVNGVNTVDVAHHIAVEALKNAGNNVRLVCELFVGDLNSLFLWRWLLVVMFGHVLEVRC